MKWEGRRQSENVEVAEEVQHPVYGEMDVSTNLASGEVMSVTAKGLTSQCRPELLDSFIRASSGEDKPGVMRTVSELIGSLTKTQPPPTDCELKASAFFNEYSRGEGFNIEFGRSGWQAVRLTDAPAQEGASTQQMPEEEKYTKLSPDAGVKSGM